MQKKGLNNRYLNVFLNGEVKVRYRSRHSHKTVVSTVEIVGS